MKLLTFVFLILGTTILHAQKNDTDSKLILPERYSLVGLNTTPLLVQLIPFNRTDPIVTGPYNITFQRFKGKNGFRFSLGAFLDFDSIESEEDFHLNIRLGWASRRVLAGNWAYTHAWDAYLSAGDLNFNGVKEEESATLGIGPSWGVEFFINKTVNLSIESSLLIGIAPDDEGFKFTFIPPVALNINLLKHKK